MNFELSAELKMLQETVRSFATGRGAYGYSNEYPVARYFRDAPTYAMVEGSANICKFIMARDQLAIRKASR